MDIPKKTSIVESVEFKKGELEQWKAFGDLLAVSNPKPVSMKTEITDKLKLQDDFLKNVWNGNESVSSFIERKQNEYNEGIKIYQQMHSDYDPNIAIDEDWDISY